MEVTIGWFSFLNSIQQDPYRSESYLYKQDRQANPFADLKVWPDKIFELMKTPSWIFGEVLKPSQNIISINTQIFKCNSTKHINYQIRLGWMRVCKYNIPPPSRGLEIHLQLLQPPVWEEKRYTSYTIPISGQQWTLYVIISHKLHSAFSEVLCLLHIFNNL